MRGGWGGHLAAGALDVDAEDAEGRQLLPLPCRAITKYTSEAGATDQGRDLIIPYRILIFLERVFAFVVHCIAGRYGKVGGPSGGWLMMLS